MLRQQSVPLYQGQSRSLSINWLGQFESEKQKFHVSHVWPLNVGAILILRTLTIAAGHGLNTCSGLGGCKTSHTSSHDLLSRLNTQCEFLFKNGNGKPCSSERILRKIHIVIQNMFYLHYVLSALCLEEVPSALTFNKMRYSEICLYQFLNFDNYDSGK